MNENSVTRAKRLIKIRKSELRKLTRHHRINKYFNNLRLLPDSGLGGHSEATYLRITLLSILVTTAIIYIENKSKE